MKRLFFFLFVIPATVFGQTSFNLSGYTANRTYTNNAYTYTNTQNGYTLSVRVTHNSSPTYINLTGATSPNYATYGPSGCSAITGLFLASNRSSLTPVITTELSFSPPVCGPVTFRIFDINGEDVNVSLGYGFRDDVTVSAYDQDNAAIALSTAMVTNNGGGNCGGGNYGANYVHTSGNSLKVVGCTYDNCYWDYFTISSPTKMISRVVIDYATGNRDWNGNSITNPNWQWIILNDIRAYTPTLSITPNCGTNPVQLTGAIVSPFPPSTSPYGVPASYPALPTGNRPSAPTYLWTGSGVTFNPPNALTTLASGLSDGSNVQLTVQNNRGCLVTGNLGLTTANCAILPVELMAFEGQCAGNERNFQWSTASEYNNDHFDLEQSTDAIHFSAAGRTPGAGYSNSLRHYALSLPGGGGDYFRLAQYDAGGGVSYSRVIYVPCAATPQLSIYPNPAGQTLNLSWEGLTDNSPMDVRVLDVLGREVKAWENQLPVGMRLSLVISDLASGAYFCKLIDPVSGRSYGEQKFVKQ